MERPPRRPGKRLLGKLILWRCFFVSSLLVILVLGMYGKHDKATFGGSLGETALVFGLLRHAVMQQPDRGKSGASLHHFLSL